MGSHWACISHADECNVSPEGVGRNSLGNLSYSQRDPCFSDSDSEV